MTDKQLLEFAAKAAGIKGHFGLGGTSDTFWLENSTGESTGAQWNPFTDDGAALRLAVKLGIDIEWRSDGRVSCFRHAWMNDEGICYRNATESSRKNVERNTRRAIVRAAALIGEKME